MYTSKNNKYKMNLNSIKFLVIVFQPQKKEENIFI